MPNRPKYVARSLEPVLRRAARDFPVLVLVGPRQSGKTTLLLHVFGQRHRYVSLEPPDVAAAATEDPRAFLAAHAPPAIFDEIQHAPALLPYIKERVDRNRSASGQYLLTGSQNLLLLERVTESLAGRAGVFRLLPLSRREAAGLAQAPLPWEAKARHEPRRAFSQQRLWSSFLVGGYPELVCHPRRSFVQWHRSYVQTYLERDVRTLRQIGDLTQFQAFLRVLAARSSQLLNLADISRDLGVALNTVKAWLSVLEASFQVVVVRPYSVNIGKRLVKTPKIYFTDVGTLCSLVGLETPRHAASGPMAGAIFETAVLSELMRTLVHRGQEPRVYFWRTSTGQEVDFLTEARGKLVPIEVKLSATPRTAMAAGIAALRADLGPSIAPGYVIHPGEVRLPLGAHALALPFTGL